MYGFLILLPLTLISLVVGALIAVSPQIADYVEYFTDIPVSTDRLNEVLANRQLWMQAASHVIAYIILCFVLLATVRTVSTPLPSDRPAALRVFQLILEVVFVSLPSTVLLWISGRALYHSDWNNWIHWFAVGVICIGLVVSILGTARRWPLELYRSFSEPFRLTKTDAFAALCVLLILATVAAFAIDPRGAARVVGMFPVLMAATAVCFLGVAAVFSRTASPVAVISSLISIVLVLHIVDQALLPVREFRYRKLALPKGAGPTVTALEVKAQRKIPDLATAFHQWLELRRPAIEEYKKKGRAYPVFFVSAQGGGMYAAYHPALSLARLTDYCPEFAQHLFGISSVSGGSLGAAVYAELLRVVPSAERGLPAAEAVGCSRPGDPFVYKFLQTKVQAFFQTDFLSPVIASAVLFDIPSFVIPQLRFGHDRARALEFGFEAAWENLGLPGREQGMTSDFFERWEPGGPAPALFMSATGVNFGIPVLLSQLDWSFNPSRGISVKGPKKGAEAALVVPDSELEKTILERLQNPDDQLQVGVANLLDFRPDVQLTTSTAVVLSARFPFVTPPGLIKRNDQISLSRGAIFQKIKVLELADGGFYDNSGSLVARDIIDDLNRALDTDDRLKPFKNDIRFHLIRFTDTPAKRQALAKEDANFELVSALAAYDAVRLSRGVFLASPRRTAISNVYLLDDWYEGTLNWLLSRSTKINIEKRSSWIAFGNEVCCEVKHPAIPNVTKRIPLDADQVKQLQSAGSQLILTSFIPNADDFLRVMRLMNEGVPPPAAPATNP
jgi:hypothetical protein